jgi:hypothetical protein
LSPDDQCTIDEVVGSPVIQKSLDTTYLFEIYTCNIYLDSKLFPDHIEMICRKKMMCFLSKTHKWMINLQIIEMTQKKIKELKLHIWMTYYLVFEVPLNNIVVLHHLQSPIKIFLTQNKRDTVKLVFYSIRKQAKTVKSSGKQASWNGGGLSLRRDVTTMLIHKKMVTMRL